MGRMQLSTLPGLRTFGDPRVRRTAAIVVFVGATVHFALLVLSAFGNMPDLREVFLPSARAALAGQQLYHRLPLGAAGQFTVGTAGAVDTPPFLLLISPLTLVTDAHAQATWMVVQLISLVAAMALTYAGIGRPTLTELLAALSVLMFLGPVGDSLQDGQVSTVLGALMAATMLGHQKARPAAGGVALGIAGALKLTPLLTIPYFLWKRDFRLCAWALGTSFALFALSVASGRANGFSQFPVVVSQLSAGTAAAQNQSIGGLILRLVLPGRTNFPIAPPPLELRVFIGAAQLGLLALLVWLARRVSAVRPLGAWIQFSLVLVLVPTFQPFAWPHHWAWAVLAVPVCVAAASRGVLAARAAAGVATALLLVTIFEFPLYSAAVVYDRHPPAGPAVAVGASLPLLGAIVIAVLLALGSHTGEGAGARRIRPPANAA